jgi:hypothetical protein
MQRRFDVLEFNGACRRGRLKGLDWLANY